MNYPFYPGSYGSDTSDAAAEAIAPVVRLIKRRVLIVLADAPTGLTAHEVAAALDVENTTSQPRLTEMLVLGIVEDSGERRRNRSGSPARVWIITEKGLKALGGGDVSSRC